MQRAPVSEKRSVKPAYSPLSLGAIRYTADDHMKRPVPAKFLCETTEGDSDRSTICRQILAVALLSLFCVAPGTPLKVHAHPAQAIEPSVILISIDTLRADHLSAYGYSKIRTPHIDAFADGGTLFAHAEAQVPLTLPSHTSLFTSTYPFQNLIEENGERVPADAVTLAAVLQSHGYKTGAFIGSDFLGRRYGLDQGFDEYDSPFGEQTTGVRNPLAASLRRDGALVVRAARQWLNAHRDQSVFVFIHLFDLHVPYTLPPEVARKQGISRYDAQLTYVDQVLGRFQQDLKQDGWWDKSLVLVFGDHGEGLGDHRETDHGYYIYESTLHVPLIVHWPHSAEAGISKLKTGNPAQAASFHFPVSYSSPVGLIDVAPTILDYLRIPAPAPFEGISLLGRLKETEAANEAVYSESVYAHDAFGWARLRALRVGKYKYIQAPRAELYDLAADPDERRNLLPANSAMQAEFQNQLAALLVRYKPSPRVSPAALSPETLAELESLGYLAASPRRGMTGADGDKSLPDPKDRFDEFESYQIAYLDFTEGHAAAAIPKLLSILKSDPENTLARYHLGDCYLQTKKPQEALSEWTTLLKLNPDYAPAAEALGDYWLAHGDCDKARRRFEQVLALSPESFDGNFRLAVAEERLGMVAEARRHLETACKIAPHNEACARELKTLSTK
jgi:choline-sulfatase